MENLSKIIEEKGWKNMHLLIDTNVILDVLLNRSEFVQNAANILRLNDTDFQKYVSASAITGIYYIAYSNMNV